MFLLYCCNDELHFRVNTNAKNALYDPVIGRTGLSLLVMGCIRGGRQTTRVMVSDCFLVLVARYGSN